MAYKEHKYPIDYYRIENIIKGWAEIINNPLLEAMLNFILLDYSDTRGNFKGDPTTDSEALLEEYFEQDKGRYSFDYEIILLTINTCGTLRQCIIGTELPQRDIKSILQYVSDRKFTLESRLNEVSKAQESLQFMGGDFLKGENESFSFIFFKGEIQNFYIKLKTKYQEESTLLDRISKKVKEEIKNEELFKNKPKSRKKSEKKKIYAFKWLLEEPLLDTLYGKLVEGESKIIDTDIDTFKKSFSGEELKSPLQIRWCVQAKNGSTSKSTLFYWIMILENHDIILQSEGNKSNPTINQVFVDRNGAPFDNLKQSKSSASDNPAKGDVLINIAQEIKDQSSR